MTIATQVVWLFVLAIPISCISWTITHEEIFREPHEWCVKRSQNGRSIWSRKFFYLFTCEYCFSHYISVLFIILCDYTLLLNDWRGYVIALFSLVFVANIYMSLFGLLRQAIKKEKVVIKKIESEDDKNIDIKI